jgi:predicted DNA-binding transcriptional regulator YafY
MSTTIKSITDVVTEGARVRIVALYDTLHETIDRRGALCILYATGGTTQKARVIVPNRIEIGKYADRVIAWDSVRNCELPFRIDRIAAYHKLPVKGVA